MKHIRVLINYNAGNTKRAIEDRIYNILKSSDYTFDFKYSEIIMSDAIKGKLSNVERLVRNAAVEDITNLIVVSGDGVIHDVVNGIMNSFIPTSEYLVAIIPTGCGNDLARGLNIKNIEEGLDIIKGYYVNNKLNKKEVDIFAVSTDEFFRFGINSVDAAYGSYMINFLSNRILGKILKKLFKSLSYSLAVPLTYSTYKSRNIKLKINENLEIEVNNSFLTNLQNCEFTGGGMRICPGAKVDDGKFDFVLGRKLNYFPPVGLLWKAKRGKLIDDARVDYYLVEKIEISGINEDNLGNYIIIDGELYRMNNPIKKISYFKTGEKINFLT